MEEEPYEIFKIQVDLNGEKSELEVQSFERNYVIFRGNEELCQIKYVYNKFEPWTQTKGNLNQIAINMIGEAIINYIP